MQSGGDQYVSEDGKAFNTSLAGISAYQFVRGGSANDTVLTGYRAQQTIISGGVANNTRLGANTSQMVYSTGTANNTVLSSGSLQTVFSGGVANSTVIQAYAAQLLSPGASSVDVVQQTYAKLNLTLTGNDPGTYVSGINANGQPVLVESSYASGLVINGGGFLNISSGGRAEDVVQSASGNINTIIQQGDGTFLAGRNEYGAAMSLNNGVASNLVVNAGGSQTIINGGSAVNTLVNGGVQYVKSGGTTINETISGGSVYVDGGVASGIVQVGGTLVLASGGQVLNYAQQGGMLHLYMDGADSTLKATGTNENGSFFVSNGVASNVMAQRMVLINASANSSYIKGLQYVSSGGVADHTALLSGVSLYFVS